MDGVKKRCVVGDAGRPSGRAAHRLRLFRIPSRSPVAVSFSRDKVNPKGAQAIHAVAFPPPFSGVSVEGFNAVNEGIPGGSDDQIGDILLPAGWTLWVTYHLEWGNLSSLIPGGIALDCGSANQDFSITATVNPGNGTQVCTSGGSGYKK